MIFKYRLPDTLIRKASTFREFAAGGAQATFKLKDGSIYKDGLIACGTWIIAMKGHADLPFAVEDIEDVWQTREDTWHSQPCDWFFWDKFNEPQAPPARATSANSGGRARPGNVPAPRPSFHRGACGPR